MRSLYFIWSLFGQFVCLTVLHCSAIKVSHAQLRVKELLSLHSELQGPDTFLRSSILHSYKKGVIPPIIHQTWKRHDLPVLYQQWSASWPQVNTGWLHVIWSDDENRSLLEQHYPSLLQLYDSLPLNICRVDTVRALILHRYGGIYTDLDSQALRPMDKLMQREGVVLGRMGENPDFTHSIPNAFMASTPDEHFWLYFVGIISQFEERHAQTALRVESIAGPVALKAAVDSYRSSTFKAGQQSNMTVLDAGVVYPIDWSAKKRGTVPDICDWGGHKAIFNASECIRLHYPKAYSVQFWTHGWG